MNRGALLALLFIFATAGSASAQELPKIRSYALNAAQWTDSSAFARGGLSDVQRLRFMTEPTAGPLSLEIAYEQFLAWVQYEESGLGGPLGSAVAPSGGEWLNLQWTITDSDHFSWRHRFDRLNAALAIGDAAEIKVGRQTISWATTLFLTPADPFAPFDPSDPFREYRAGVDAARARSFLGAFSEGELVVRAADTPIGETLTVLGRGQSLLLGWEVSAWAGVLHDEPAMGLGASGSLGPAAVRGEGSLREEDGDLIVRGTLGVDRRFDVFDRDLYLVFEYQHDDFGASSGDDLARAFLSDAVARGELQVFGRDETAAQAAYQIHPLWSADVLLLWNLNDGSLLLGPGASYSVSNEATARAGIFFGLGTDQLTAEGLPLSEYGLVPAIFYASLSLFF